VAGFRDELLKYNLDFLNPIIDKTMNQKLSALEKPEIKNMEAYNKGIE